MPLSLDVVLVVAFAALGLRALWTWARRPFAGTAIADHVLYAAFVTARVGLWFALAGAFALYAVVRDRGGSVREHTWYLVVPLVLAGLQIVTAWFLARRSPDDGGATPPP